MLKRNTLKLIAVSALSAGAVAILAACSPDAAKLRGVDITGADYARDFRLTDHNGQVRSLQDFRGKVVVVFFGFTQCPDVCPTSMQELAEVKQQLGADADRLQGIFITVDPERDQLEMLKAYMGNFDPTFLALRPTPEQLPALAKDFKIYFKKVDGQTPASYTMDHTAGDYIFDPQGRLRLYNRYGTSVDTLAKDIELLLDGA